MSMNAPGGREPSVTLTDSNGVVYRLPTYGMNGQPAPVSLSPDEPFDQVNVVGDTEKVSDRRTSQLVPSDQTGGAGRDRYSETEGINDYRWSEWDTRHAGAMVMPPAITALGTLPSYAAGVKLLYAGYTGATIHAWSPGTPLYYHPGTGTTWTSCTGIPGGVTYGYAQGFGYTFAAGAFQVARSANGTSFTAIAAGAFPFGCRALAVFDNKLWVTQINTTNSTLDLYVSSNPTAAAASVAWTLAVTFPYVDTQTEAFVDFVVWKDASGTPGLFLLTSQRLLYYNQIGGVIVEYDNFAENNPEGGPVNTGAFTLMRTGIIAAHFKTTGDLFVGQGTHNDYLMRYSPGAGFEKDGPNKNGGLPANMQGGMRAIAQNAYGLGVWTSPTTVVGGTPGTAGAQGVAWFRAAEGGWHCLYRPDTAGPLVVLGGGMGGRKYWTIHTDGSVVECQLPTTGSKPQFAIGRTYRTNLVRTHQYGVTDGGTTLLNKNLIGFTVHSIKSDGTGLFGLDANCTIQVYYKVDGGAWTVVQQFIGANGVIQTVGSGQITAATTQVGWPLRMVIAFESGIKNKEVEWRIDGITTNSANTPVIVTVAPRYLRVPSPRYTYEFVTDATAIQQLGGPTMGGGLARVGGRSVNALHEALTTIDNDPLLYTLTYGEEGQARTVRACEFAMAPQHLPHLGVGKYRIVLRDVGADPSGF